MLFNICIYLFSRDVCVRRLVAATLWMYYYIIPRTGWFFFHALRRESLVECMKIINNNGILSNGNEQ